MTKISPEELAIESWDDDGGEARIAPSTSKNVSQKTSLPEYFSATSFRIPELKGISQKNIKEHLELYSGYVKSSNHILSRIQEMPKDDEQSAYELSLLQRRFAYEYNGMKNHELFFEQFEGGAHECKPGGAFLKQARSDFGSFGALLGCLKGIAMTRGIGWTMLYYCHESGHLIPQWVDEHHVGLLSGPQLVFALDMWEHAFIYDYPTSEKAKYVDAFFNNLNWSKVEGRYRKFVV